MSAISPKKYCLFKLFEILWHCSWLPLPYSFTPSVHLLVRKSLFFSSIIILKLSVTQRPKMLEFLVLLHTEKDEREDPQNAWNDFEVCSRGEAGGCFGRWIWLLWGIWARYSSHKDPCPLGQYGRYIINFYARTLRIISRLSRLAKCKHLVMLNNIHRKTSPLLFSFQLELFHLPLSVQSPTDRRESPESFVSLITALLFVSQVRFPGYLWQISVCIAVSKQQHCFSLETFNMYLLIWSIFHPTFSNLFINLLLRILWKQ